MQAHGEAPHLFPLCLAKLVRDVFYESHTTPFTYLDCQPLALRRERICDFCGCELPDWRAALTPPDTGAAAPAIMVCGSFCEVQGKIGLLAKQIGKMSVCVHLQFSWQLARHGQAWILCCVLLARLSRTHPKILLASLAPTGAATPSLARAECQLWWHYVLL